MPIPEVNPPKAWNALATRVSRKLLYSEIFNPPTLKTGHATRRPGSLVILVFQRTGLRTCGQS